MKKLKIKTPKLNFSKAITISGQISLFLLPVALIGCLWSPNAVMIKSGLTVLVVFGFVSFLKWDSKR